ncbi:unnamed protein product [Cuscuta epithymum]|uniref:Uncharacterized protein n=1 Tax=Cuscuta epithymum TaxID=186058 RepID=A0AAV0EBI6_9ASTE|nr:unnamed protein product [Cuscuta epithymum]
MIGNNVLEFLPNGNNYEPETSISGALLQADIEFLNSSHHSLDLVTLDEVQGIEHTPDSVENLKEFFQATLTNGVESLSHFLLREFERLLVSTLDNLDSLRLKATIEGKSSRTQKNSEHVDKNEKGGYYNALSDLAVSDWDYANTGFTGNDEFEKAFGESCSNLSGDEFLGHVSENEKRVPISTFYSLYLMMLPLSSYLDNKYP